MKKVIPIAACILLAGTAGAVSAFFLHEDVWPVTVISSTEEQDVLQATQSQIQLEDSDVYYFWNQLEDGQKKNYETVLEILLNRSDDTAVLTDLNKSEAEDLICMVMYDHPEIFWFDGAYTYIEKSDEVDIQFNYTKSESQIQKYQAEIDEKAASVLSDMKAADTDYEKAKIAYAYVLDQVTYDEQADENQNILSSLLYGRSVCAGYAKEIQYLLQQSGIQAVFTTGTSTVDDSSHAWIIAKIDGDYVHIDPTYGDIDSEESVLYLDEKDGDYSFFCMDDEIALDSRDIKNLSIAYPACSSAEKMFSVLHNCYYTGYTQEEKQTIANQIASLQDSVLFQFENQTDYQNFASDLQNGVYQSEVNAALRRLGYDTLKIYSQEGSNTVLIYLPSAI